MRALVLALFGLALAGCNQVYSRTPLVSERFEPGDPELRPGLWLVSGYEDRCDFDVRRPLRDWPDCAVAAEFRKGQLWFVSGHQRLLGQTLRLTDGDPILVQGHWSLEILKDPRAPEPKDADNPFYGWTYAALTPVRADPNGRIREATLVQARCGPAPAGARRPDRPFPGLVMVGDNCVAKDLKTVRTALAESAKLAPPQTLRWIRDDP